MIVRHGYWRTLASKRICLVEEIPATNVEKRSDLQAGPAKDVTPKDGLLQVLQKCRPQA